MDMNTIESVVATTDPGQWRDGDAWLAGGTVLFSYGSPVGSEEPLKRLLDLGQAGWQSVTVSDSGVELAATCTVAELYALPVSDAVAGRNWPGLDVFRPCCDSFVASFKVWNMSTVGGNVCTSLPAGPMISLCAGLDATATILGRHGSSRTVPVAEFVTGDGKNSLAPGELLRSIQLPASALSARVAFRRLSLSNLGRSGVLLIGRLDADGSLVLTVTAATKRPVQLRFAAAQVLDAGQLAAAVERSIPPELYHDDIHGLPEWRRDMTVRLAEEIRMELLDPAGHGGPFTVSGDFWPPHATSQQPSTQPAFRDTAKQKEA
ncbi:FAD binding domain-containing protein [Arthrobacter sp. MI7-26]|uniref:FAD binding domain-containing protein n=1 Tax=Arthrobacter sp. MI7-26 TaxID=2993653 RepID=UPI0022495BAF|nr:FAD binding domain-containing protein [Arthrobacter sp. MI7-26]MCX2747856.1 FAD binding domain-containing protein [Arthrobacter sp. MI7-26]